MRRTLRAGPRSVGCWGRCTRKDPGLPELDEPGRILDFLGFGPPVHSTSRVLSSNGRGAKRDVRAGPRGVGFWG
jgi:hypothetical protein